ncbi:MAG TPA: glycoside hydrolase family 130 protein [Rhizorhapis sp.]|nr:glycoside hydrolase family 130 protein [Rhizorhapis sp.]
MIGQDILTYSSVILRPDPSRTVIRPFEPGDPPAFADKNHPRAQRIADRILGLSDAELEAELREVTVSLDDRHRDVEQSLLRRFHDVNGLLIDRCSVSRGQSLLIGAYFSEEFSFEAAALFNPSIVLHWDQSNLPDGTIRFVISLRSIGEGHVSSVTFRTGTWHPHNGVIVDLTSALAVAPRIEQSEGHQDDGLVRLNCRGSRDISETVLFPTTASQKQGIEDLRLVRFAEDDGTHCYLGTYTAYSGAEIRQEMLRSRDFRTFVMRPVQGAVAASKGLAFFPRRIHGRYLALSRHDNESLWLLESDSLHIWNGGSRIVMPHYPWEFIQLGNCGSPIEIEEGWLVITHGVGMVRNYCLGACLLDKDDPSKLLARMPEPLVRPSEKERDGYVPNVVYSCGAMVHDRTLLLPYGVADSFVTFASVPIDKLLAAMI